MAHNFHAIALKMTTGLPCLNGIPSHHRRGVAWRAGCGVPANEYGGYFTDLARK